MTASWLNGSSITDALVLELVILSEEQKMFGKETIFHRQYCQLSDTASQMTTCMTP